MARRVIQPIRDISQDDLLKKVLQNQRTLIEQNAEIIATQSRQLQQQQKEGTRQEKVQLLLKG